MSENADILSRFHPLIARWFSEKFGRPTDVQKQAWPRIANEEHVLITAPTGSGKTLTAFLWAVNQLATREWSAGHTCVLYVSPLKALNNDIRRNLLVPLSELKRIFESEGADFPAIHVQTRSGDTPESERRRMLRHPPEILITTPESLNLLLSSAGGRSILMSLLTVVMDEIHAVVGNKRGTHLITAVDRLVPLSGEFQRIALSATIRPLETMAGFVAGFTLDGSPISPQYTRRRVSIVQAGRPKKYDIRVRFPEEGVDRQIQESVWDPLVSEFKKVISGNRSTLLFANSRRLCEKLTLKINHGEGRPVAYAHHGSLSREIRGDVERKLKAGDLLAIVATNSLELGIDIGALDEVLLVQSPPSISSAIQRVGRAGHDVGKVSRGTIVPTHAHDFLEAAVLAPSIISQDIETLEPVECPLDVLAQVIVSMVGVEPWNIDELYARLRTSYPYRHLRREHFDLVLNMLGGRYADSRIRELKPRVSIDRLDNSVVARKGALLVLYTSGGTIPDRGYFHLRHQDTNALIGELDEEFVWEAKIGQTFALGTQNWRIQRITHNDVFVTSGPPKGQATPFWIGEENSRDFHFSERIARFLEFANHHLDDPDFPSLLQQNHCMDSTASAQLIAYLKRQKSATNCDLPHRHHLLVEFVDAGPGSAPGNQVFLHTMWGGRVNRPFAMALDAAWDARFGHRLEAYAANDCVVLVLPNQVTSEELLSLVTSTTVEPFLRKRLEGSGFFGARFRECAARSLLLTRNKMSERMPLWMSRLRSQKLLDAVLQYEDFPILLEAWRTCLQDESDMESLRQVLAELENGSIHWSEIKTGHPSPMAQNVAWRQISEYMYRGDEPSSGKRSSLRNDLLRDIVYTPALRPTVTRQLLEEFELKRRRLSPGYSPSTPRDLLDWVKERLLIPASEWASLLEAVRRDHGLDTAAILDPIKDKLLRLMPQGACEPLIVALETLPRVTQALVSDAERIQVKPISENAVIPAPDGRQIASSEEDRAGLLTNLMGEWLRFYGPKTTEFIQKTLGIDDQRLLLTIEDLIDSKTLISGGLVTNGDDDDICDSENFEILLRLARADAVPVFEPLEGEWLPVYMAWYQGLTHPQDNIEGLFRRLEQLLCYPAEAQMWETEILPARAHPYNPSRLDAIMQEGDLRWMGSGNRRVLFCFESDLDLLQEEVDSHKQTDAASDIQSKSNAASLGREASSHDDIFPDARGRYDFSTLLRVSKLSPKELGERLWNAVWQGQVANDTFLALRRGIQNRFKTPEIVPKDAITGRSSRRSGRRSSFARWKSAAPFAGNWFLLSSLDFSEDVLEIEERNKDRVRLLFDRYGILFRELLQRELPPFQWPSVFRSLRLMELSGEVLGGYFFHGIPGLQFMSHQAFHMLQRKPPQEAIYWINATDPASLCGIRLDANTGMLPKRTKSTHLVYHGATPVMISERHGKVLTIRVPPEDPNLQVYFAPLHHLLTREFQPLRRIPVETINGEAGARSPYVDALRTSFEVVIDHRHITLYRSRQSWGIRASDR